MQARLEKAVLLLTLIAASRAALAQTDVAASLYGAFNQTTKGNGVVQSPSNAAGGLLELRHIRNPLIGYEATYSFNRANQAYLLPGSISSAEISTNAHEFTGDWLVSLKLASFRPFALAGGGVLVNAPTATANNPIVPANTRTSKQGVLVYGAGVDWTVLPHLGLRFQYRGNVYKAPDLTNAFSSTGAFTRTAEPMIGAFFRF